tara:strand:+ start:24386 stop:25573 length:1188 start_codon:yes stop_codon:yes gene_type:complete
MSKTGMKKIALPKSAQKRLMPFVKSGIEKGLWSDNSTVSELWNNHASDDKHSKIIKDLGGIKSETAQNFVTDSVLIDLSSILRQRRYLAHVDIWEVSHRTVGLAKGNPRPACFIIGQAVVEDTDGSSMETALFRMSLWDEDASLADDVEANNSYSLNVSCKNLDSEILDLKSLSGLSKFKVEEFEHEPRENLLREMFEVTQIADLEDEISRGPTDYRLVEAVVSYSGVQNSKAGNQFGKMLLKDDSTMTMEAIESGENLLLNAITSSEIASRFGKYSKILALVTTKNNGEYGLSANMETAIGLVIVEPAVAELPTAKVESDDAANYFKVDTSIPMIVDDDDDTKEVAKEAETKVEAKVVPKVVEETVEATTTEETKQETKVEAEVDGDDDWDDWD